MGVCLHPPVHFVHGPETRPNNCSKHCPQCFPKSCPPFVPKNCPTKRAKTKGGTMGQMRGEMSGDNGGESSGEYEQGPAGRRRVRVITIYPHSRVAPRGG